MSSEQDSASRAHDAMPGQAVAAIVQCPGNLPRCAAEARRFGNLPVAGHLAARNRANSLTKSGEHARAAVPLRGEPFRVARLHAA